MLRRKATSTGYDRIDDGQQGILRIQLKYGRRGEPVIHEIKRMTKAGRRDLPRRGELPEVLNGHGDRDRVHQPGRAERSAVQERKVGGELICTVC